PLQPVGFGPSTHVAALQTWHGWQVVVAPVQTPPLQLPLAVHALASPQAPPSFPAGCSHAPAPLHWSSVHTLPSSVHDVPLGLKQSLAVSSQRFAHSGPPVHGLPACVHTPPLQTSAPSQKSPSSHGAVLFGWMHVPAPLQ